MRPALKLALMYLEGKAKYKNKKEVPKADGSGTTTVYEYGDRYKSNRDKEKANRVEKLRQGLKGLRKKYTGALTSDDPSERLTALAVALIDHTYERVGNDASAKNGHFGVTGWQKKHITFSGDSATLTYVGKSGVKHKKKVTDSKLVKALKEAVKGKKPGDKILCDGANCSITSKEVNNFLRDFEITAKDIRGLHANEEVKRALKEVRKKGPELPRARKEKDKILKDELKEALEIAAGLVGHEASTLKSQYLVPGMVDSFLHDGTVMEKLNKKGSDQEVYQLWKLLDDIDTAGDLAKDDDALFRRLVQGYQQARWDHVSGARVEALYERFYGRTATKSRTEREDEEAEKLIKPSPKKKPPREDLRNKVVEDEPDDDPDKKQDKKDRSQNYKDASPTRVALRFFLSGEGKDIPEWAQGKKFTHEETGNKVDFPSLPPEQQKKLRDQNSKDEEEDPKEEEKEKTKEEQAQEAKSNLVEDVLSGLSSKDQGQVEELLGTLSEEQFKTFSKSYEEAQSALLGDAGDLKALRAGASKSVENQSPAEMGKILAQANYWNKVVDDPAVDLDDPVAKSGSPLKGDMLQAARKEAATRVEKAVGTYRQLEKADRQDHFDRLEREITNLDDGDPRRVQLEAVQRGIGMASALEDGDEATGIASSMARLVKAADESGNLQKLAEVSTYGASDKDSQAVVRKVYEDLGSDDWEKVVPEDHPGRPLAELLADPEKNKLMTEDDMQRVREHLTDLMMADTAFLDPAVTAEVGRDAVVAKHKSKAKAARKKAMPKKAMPPATKIGEMVAWAKEYTKNLVQSATGSTSPKKERERKPGEVWTTEEGFAALSPSGESGTFEDREEAKAFAQGRAKQGSLDWDFSTW